MLITSALAAILCLVAMTSGASAGKSKGRIPVKDGLVLTDLWKEYASARKADRPERMAAVLDTILSKARSERLHYDFYTAAVRKMETEVSRDWKLQDKYREWLDKEVEEYSEPVVTFRHRLSKGSLASLTDYVMVNRARLQAARNGAFYDTGLDDLWTGMIKDDYEHALWTLAAIRRSEKAMTLLEEYVGDSYPKAAYLEYRRMVDGEYSFNDEGRAEKEAALRSFIDRYEGRAISLLGKAAVLRSRFDSLSRLEEPSGGALRQPRENLERSFRALYADCKAAEKERLSSYKGIDREIARKVTDFKSLMESLDRKEIGVSFEKDTVVLTLRNLAKVEVEFTPDVKGSRPLLRGTLNNPWRSFFVLDTVKVGLPGCDDGDYILTARNGKVVSKAVWTKRTLSVALRRDSEALRFFVADHLTGKPLEKVDLELSRSGKTVALVKDVTLCRDGFTPLPDAVAGGLKAGAANCLVASYRDPEGFLHKTEDHYIYGDLDSASGREDASSGVFCELFTDKSAYNPGEKVGFKAVLYKGDPSGSLRTFEAGVGVKAELVNPEGLAVGGEELLTNDHGSVAGSFDLPADGRMGKFLVRISGGGVNSSKGIVVDEFIFPTYDLSFDGVDRLFMAGDTVEVCGKVLSFSGHPLSSVSMTYSVSGRGRTVAAGKTRPDADGSFVIRFGTEDNEDCGGLLRLVAKVVDRTGETKEFSKLVPVLSRFSLAAEVTNAAEGEVSLYEGGRCGTPFMVSGEKADVSFRAKDLMGNEIKSPVEVKYSLTDASGKEILSGRVLSGVTEVLALPAAGLYCLDSEAEITGETGRKVTAKNRVTILRVDDSASVLDAKVRNVFKLVGDCADGRLRDGERIRVQFGAGEGPVWAVVELFGDKRQLLEHRMVCLDGKVGETGSLAEITYEYKEEYPDAVRLKVFYFRDGSSRSFDREFRRERLSLELPLSFSSFTDKALPGTEYSLTLKAVPEAEAVAAVFDRSSETVCPNRWPEVRLSGRGAENVFVSCSLGGVHGDPDVAVGYGSPDVRIRAAGGVNAVRSMALTADAEGDGLAGNVAETQYLMAKNASAKVDEVEDVAVRSDFSSSLAFEPFLRSDADGNVVLRFRTSDRLSTFVVQVWAHTREMLNASVRREMVVTVPVKVSVAGPEYLYKGDRFVLRATVSNSSDRPVTGVAALRADSSKDLEGAKPFAAASKKVTVPARGSVAVSFDVDPKGRDGLGLKVVFADDAGTFSDGVSVSIPVREAKQTLIESHSAVLPAGADKAALVRHLEAGFTGTTAKGAEVKEMDIRRMILDAVPSKVEPDGQDVLSLTEALYVRKVAASLGSGIETEMSDEVLVERINACLNADGGFGWFEGMRSSPVVTAVVLERLAKMRSAGLDFGGLDLTGSVKWLDRNQFLRGSAAPAWCGRLSMEQYAFVRSMYSGVPFDISAQTGNDKSECARNFKEFKKSVKDYLVPSAKDGRGLDGQILAKARRIRTLANLVDDEDGSALASAWGLRLSAASKMGQSIAADVRSLLEYAVRHADGGWYYPNAVMPWRGLLESEAYAHAMLCDLLSSPFAEAAGASALFGASAGQVADGIRLWLMLQKETQKWGDDPAFVDAINSVLTGSDEILATKVVSLVKMYLTPFSKVKAAGNGLAVERRFYKEVRGEDGKAGRLEVLPGMRLCVGDKVTAEYRLRSQENRSFVRLTAPREAAFRPVDQLSGACGRWLRPVAVDGIWSVTPQGYRNVRTDRTEYWFDVCPEETTAVTEDFFITQEGIFTAPVVTIESLYAPHYRANAAFKGTLETSADRP